MIDIAKKPLQSAFKRVFGVFKVLTCDFLLLASFGGAPYSLDETGVVKGVFKARCAVGARMQIADKMSVDLSHVDRRTHESTGDRGLLGWYECDV
jgi:hypothetical protein